MKSLSTPLTILVFATFALTSCITPAEPRMGMVRDEHSGLMYGSAI